jgi:hypothetical protein
MDLKQKGDVLIVKMLAHLRAARFHSYHQVTADATTLLKLSVLLSQVLPGHIQMIH